MTTFTVRDRPQREMIHAGDRPVRRGWLLAAAMALGLGAVASALVPWGHAPSFLWNLGFTWAPPVIVIAILVIVRARPAVVVAAALTCLGILVGFHLWLGSAGPQDALAWLFYPLCFPGVVVGALAAVLAGRRRTEPSGMGAGLAALALTAGGAALDVAVVLCWPGGPFHRLLGW